MEFLELTFSRHDTCNLLCDTSLALARSSPTRRYTGTLTSTISKSFKKPLFVQRHIILLLNVKKGNVQRHWAVTVKQKLMYV